MTRISRLIYKLLLYSQLGSWSASMTLGLPQCRTGSSANLAAWRSQLALLTVWGTRESPEQSLSTASQASPRKAARNLWIFPELACYAWHLCSRAGDLQVPFQTHGASACPAMSLPFSVFFWYCCRSMSGWLWEKEAVSPAYRVKHAFQARKPLSMTLQQGLDFLVLSFILWNEHTRSKMPTQDEM